MSDLVRINKYLADKGICSRREADGLIEKGQVFINGKPAKLGDKVSDSDQVEVKGLSTKDKHYLAYYKGRGVITHSPEENETDIREQLQSNYGSRPELDGVAPVGRLDKDSEGLLILTDDGRVTGPLLDPQSGHEKEYVVIVDKPINNHFIKLMSNGVNIEGYKTKPASVTANSKNQYRFNIILTEGKKHQIRRMCAALGYQVQSLKRTRVLNIELGQLKPNQYRILKGAELKTFLKKLNIKN